MSNIAIIGATGRAGSQLLEEALRRGHRVVAIARHASKIGERAGVVTKEVDVNDAQALQTAVAGSDVVLSAAHFSTLPAAAIIEPVKKRVLNVCCLWAGPVLCCYRMAAKSSRAPIFLEAYKPEATAGGIYLDTLRAEKDLDWTFLSPSAEFVEGSARALSVWGKTTCWSALKAKLDHLCRLRHCDARRS